MSHKSRKPWHSIFGKDAKISKKIYEAAKTLKENGYTRDEALAHLRRRQFAYVPPEFVKKYVYEAFEE